MVGRGGVDRVKADLQRLDGASQRRVLACLLSERVGLLSILQKQRARDGDNDRKRCRGGEMEP